MSEPASAPATRQHHPSCLQSPEPDAGPAGGRLHHLDAMRSVLMLLGVVLHAANPYRGDGGWLVADAAHSAVLQVLAAAIHAFRMPAFFVVAGYFAMRLLRRGPTGAFLRERARRLLLPTLAILLSFNLAQVWFLAPAHPPGGFLRGALLPALERGEWLGHLWFLVYLAVYCAVLAALRPCLRACAPRRGRAAPSTILGALLGAATLVPLASAVAGHLLPALTHEFAGMFDPIELLDHAPYFAVGCVLAADPVLLRRFGSAGPGLWLSAALAGLVLALLPHPHGAAAAALVIVARTVLHWGMVRMVFAGFDRWAAAPRPALRYLADASYSVYLFHHLFVVLVATALLPAPWPAAAKFALVLAAATGLPLAMHHALVRPSALARWLFNGRPRDAGGAG